MSKTTNKFSPEVRARAVRMVLDHEGEHASRWAAVSSIAAKIGCTAQTLHEWVKKAEVDSGKRAGVPSDMAEKMKALERENREMLSSSRRRAIPFFIPSHQPWLFRRFFVVCWQGRIVRRLSMHFDARTAIYPR